MGMRLQAWALAWGLPGFAIQCYGIVEGWALVSLGGTALLCVGLMYHVRGKGYHPMWGLWGLVPIMGPILLLLQPRQPGVSPQDVLQELLVEEDPHIRPFAHAERPDVSGGRALLLVMAPVGILILLFSARLPHAVAPADVAPPGPSAIVAPGPGTAAVAEPSTAAAAPSPLPGEPVKQPEYAKQREGEAPAEPQPQAESPKGSPYAAKYRQIRVGMTYDQVCELVGNDSTLISGKLGKDKIVKWENPDKSFFAARFRDNVLDRMTGLNHPPPPKKLVEMAEELRKPGEENVTVETEAEKEAGSTAKERQQSAESAPQEEAQSVDKDEETGGAQPSEGGGEEATAEEEARPVKKNVVRVGGEEKAGPRSRKAQLPARTQSIDNGPHDVYIHNETDTAVKVGLRTQRKKGRDFGIPAGGMVAQYLTNGTYRIFYIETSHPYELKNAGEIVVQSPPAAIHVTLR